MATRRGASSSKASSPKAASPRGASFDAKLARIRALEGEPAVVAAAELKRFLGEASGYLVGEAARVVAALELSALSGDVADAVLRFVAAPAEADKGCFGKRAMVEALMALDASAPEAYLAGLRHVQKEPAYGGPVDTAPSLRGMCAHALVEMDFRWAALEIAPMLHDAEPVARVAAAEALARTGEVLCAAALHVKVLSGDAEPEVLGACYKGLLALDARRYVPLVAEALRQGEELAAIALGESRLPEALGVLEEAVAGAATGKGTGRFLEGVMLGVALLRSDEGNAFLVRCVAEGSEAKAAAALGALALHRHDGRLVGHAREAVAQRGSAKLRGVLEEKLGAA
ncbi:hypothetical protein [Chondromyces crocatus]|uniref:PBS lyase n=1 Tax=Chondromyces crocatus TaxID=52 RepID=A0A0K1E7L3_CHOCO|nr:hypothetical protein [Chondromyces crocatus]AKT36855.1 uncharacterized protein CMC5_009760 [Chondromyces crocatus]